MPEEFGAHLLGRNPSPPDERDYKLSNFLSLGQTAVSSDPAQLIDLAINEFKLTTVTFKRWASTSYKDVTQTHWWKGFNYLELAKQNLEPAPQPSDFRRWENPQPTLDQGNTNHCVGFSGANWGNTEPVFQVYDNQDGHDLYYECKVVEGEPRQENGAYIRSIGEVLKARQRLSIYAFAESLEETILWVQTKGPAIFGTWWLSDMFSPNESGIVTATGSKEGGHAYLCNGFDAINQMFLFENSWGDSFGVNGSFAMSVADARKLYQDQGEILVAVELPV